MIVITIAASGVAPGDTIISPLSGGKMLIRKVESAPLGMLDFHCTDVDGERLLLTLDSDEDVRVLEQA